MQLTRFHECVEHEFGSAQGAHILTSHVLRDYGKTPAELVEEGEDLRKIWWALCIDFDVPVDRRWGPDE